MNRILRLCLALGFLAGCGSETTPPAAAPAPAKPTATAAKPAPRPQPAAHASKAPPAATSTSEPAPRQVAATPLEKLYTVYFTKGARAEFHATLQSMAPSFPEIKPSTTGKPLEWHSFTLSEFGLKGDLQFDAYRFRSPLDVPADLYLALIAHQGLGRWYIAPVRGAMDGFHAFHRDYNRDIPKLKLPPGNTVIFQELTGGKILAGEEYLLWYAAPEDAPRPRKLDLAVKLVPQGTFEAEQDAHGISRILELEPRYLTFDDSPDGMRDLLETTNRVRVDTDENDFAMLSVLRPSLARLPELKVSGPEGPLTWNHVVPTDSFTFHALRFRSPVSGPADLHWVCVSEDERPYWGLLEANSESVPKASYHAALNLQVENASLPRENLATFQSAPFGTILPDQDYILWFAPQSGALAEQRVAVRIIPHAETPVEQTVRGIAGAMGIPFPETLAPETVTAVLRRCRRLLDDLQGESGGDSYQFRSLLDYVAPALPELTLTPEGSAVKWNTVTLNDSDVPFTAVRFTTGLSGPTDLMFAISKPASPKALWAYHVHPEYGYYTANRLTDPETAVDDPGVPESNILVLDQLIDKDIPGEGTKVLFFAPEGSTRASLQVAVRASAQTDVKSTYSFRTAAKRLGVKLKTETPEGVAAVLEGHTDAVRTVAFLKSGQQLVSGGRDSSVRLWDVASGESRELFRLPGSVYRVVQAADASRIAALFDRTEDLQFVVYDLATGAQTPVPLPKLVYPNFAFSADGKTLVINHDGNNYSKPGHLFRWEIGAGAPQELDTSGTTFKSSRFTPDGRAIIAIGGRLNLLTRASGLPFTSVVQMLDAETGRVLKERTEGLTSWERLLVTDDGRRFVTSRPDGMMSVWDTETFQETASVAIGFKLTGLSMTSDGSRIVTADEAGVLRLWDGTRLRVLQLWQVPQGQAFDVAISDDGRHVAVALQDGTIRRYEPAAVDLATIEPITDSLGIRLAPIPAGEFLMGSPPTSEEDRRNAPEQYPQRPVRITRPFYLGAHEVTRGQFQKFVEATGYKTTAEASGKGSEEFVLQGKQFGVAVRKELVWNNPGFAQDETHPVVNVSYIDALEFCKWLSTKEGTVYRLPTEAEWEYACRATSTTWWNHGERPQYSPRVMNVYDADYQAAVGRPVIPGFLSDGFAHTAPVGKFVPNAWGLYDMHGNVWEWCHDWYDPVYYSYGGAEDPQGPPSGTIRVQRGGSFHNIWRDTHSSYRDRGPPDQAQTVLGFRVLRELPRRDASR